jgi:tetratricopeptide (TPR) repeat protein
MQAGNHAVAAREYEEARRIARSIEDADAIAAAAVNLSIVYQRLGRDAAAQEALAEVLDTRRHVFPERRLMQAALRRAILELAGGNAGAASDWAQRAERRCPGVACDLAPAILNVQAQAALDSRNSAEAARLSLAAADLSRQKGNRVETANALRTLGKAKLAHGEPDGAAVAFEQALELDHALADPRKILADLTELARANAARGDRTAARAYFERALIVSRALNDTRAIAELEAQMASSGGMEPVTERK